MAFSKMPAGSVRPRLAGLALLLGLLACQPKGPGPEQALLDAAQSDAQAAHRLAQRRLANQELDAAQHWFEHAWSLGEPAAATGAVMLRQRQQGALAAAKWLEQQHQQLLEDSGLDLAALGLWHLQARSQADWPFWLYPGLTDQPGWFPEQGCQLHIQPIAVNSAAARQWQQLQHDWQQDSQLSQLAVCFTPLRLISSTELACTENSATRIDCDYQRLIPYIRDASVQQLIILGGRGKASYNNGIIQLPERAGLSLLRHEFMHIFQFMDEYALPAEAAQEVCQPDRLYPNILIGRDQLAAYQQHWGRLPEPLALTPVDTCNNTPYQAYRLISESNSMEWHQLDLPDYYLQLVEQKLQQPEQLMPVQYFLAYQARLQEADADWLRLMQLAEELGYPDASRLLNLYELAQRAHAPAADHHPGSVAPVVLSD